ncbi:F-box domain-containing protein [Artemisia annua]|uniref:F-box domain-containing protein n=1 Tax=Artemisia annua TaxID=35608 RepID=A0A2U1PF90_ARTAN|nr:F-box domain-containing protein [Artemisia annua]
MSDNVPLDVQLDIMNRLPVKTILLMRSVSKIWKANIDSQTFITSYGARPTDECLFNLTFDQGYKGFMTSVSENFNITPLDSQLHLAAMMPVGNSSGLMCFMYECSKICFGFGVRPDTIDPTIVKVSYPVFQTGFWLVSPKGVPYKDYTLVSFDMVTRQFHIIEIPSLLKVVMPTPFSVCELGNSVVVSGMIMTSEVPMFISWLLNVDGTSITRFSNIFCIPTPSVNKLLGFTSNQAPIVKANVGHILGHSIFVFDPQAEQFVSLGIEGNAGSFYIAPHKESLLLINHLDRALYSMFTF